MAEQVPVSQSAEPFEFVLFEDPEHLKEAATSDDVVNPWVDPDVLKLTHRIGRGPFGDVWIGTRHVSTEDYDERHEVAIKMLPSIKEDQIQTVLAKFREVFQKCQSMEGVCFLYGVTIKNGKICIAMKFYEGSLGDKIAQVKEGKLQISDVLRYGAELAEATMNLHSRGLLVLNLKPCNFLLDENDHAILGDIGIPSLIFKSLPSSHKLGTTNYMAPEQWQPNVRGPISYETDSWGFACSMVEMLTGVEPWSGRSASEIQHMVVIKQEKPKIPSGLPPTIEDVFHGCFEYDWRNRPAMQDILHAFKRCISTGYDERNLSDPGQKAASYTDWYLLKDPLQVGDTVRSRKSKNCSKHVNMEIPEGNIVGMESQDGYVLVRVHGIHDPLKVHPSVLKRVTNGFAAGDWVHRLKTVHPNHSPVGILHSIERDGRVSAGFLGMDTLWAGNSFELQMAVPLCVGQFIRPKAGISNTRFEWSFKSGGTWATGRISQILPNGCIVVKFPGKLVIGRDSSVMADPAEVEVVDFSTCDSVVKKYQHLEDFHWAVRPLVIALGLFTALRFGLFVGKTVRRPRRRGRSEPLLEDKQQQDGQNAAWLPPNVANILFREGSSTQQR